MTRKQSDENLCELVVTKRNGRLTMKCKNLRRTPTAEEVVDSIVSRRVIFK